MENDPNQNILSQLQNQILVLETELTQIAARLEITGLNPKELAALQDQYEDITLALETLLIEWQQCSSE